MNKEQIINNFAKDINVPSKEPIMIDGVDVSGCEYIGFGIDGVKSVYPCQIMSWILPPGAADCRNFPKCQFRQLMKQLARKTQEYEELKEEYEAVKSESFTREELITLQEKDIDRYRKSLEEIEDICNVADRYELEELQETIFNIINKAKGEE